MAGIMGGGSASPSILESAYRLGCMIAQKDWVLLNGGRNSGVMEASARGARECGGLTIGILPDSDCGRASAYIDVAIVTGMGQARNSINVLSSDIVIAFPGGAGTLSEIALALKSAKPVILLGYKKENIIEASAPPGLLHYADSPEDVINTISDLLQPF